MAITDKNIVITPNIGATADPKITFSGADASTTAQNIDIKVYPTTNGTLSFEGSAGQLFSIANSLTGTLFSVNDISGIPSIVVQDTGLIKLAQYSGNVILGTSTDNATDKLQVNGSITGTVLKSSIVTGTAPFTVASTTVVTNLNADMVDGLHASSFALTGHNHAGVYEPVIAAGTTSQYYRGDKTWVTLDKVAVGLANIDNTSDVNKPISTATQTALNLLAPLASPSLTGVPVAPTAAVSTNTTQLATTAFVVAQLANSAPTKTGTNASGTWGISVTGNASTATKLATPRNMGITGDATGTVVFDGSADVSTTITLASVATAGTYNSVTVDAKGRVTTGTNPTTLAGYGITDAISSSLKGVANGIATLDASGFIPASQLPSYVDDVLEFANLASFPATGETGKIYTAIDSNKIYRWSGTVYIEISPTAGNADSATKLATARSITLTGDATGTVTFDGSANVSFATTLATSGVTAGTYNNVATTVTPFTIDANGRVTSTGAPITIAPAFSSLTGAPTTLAGYGITDAAPLSHVGSGATAHALVTGSVAGFMSAADKSKLDGIASGANSGTVTSVALSLPPIFTVTGSPVTTTGTLTAALATQTANTFWAAPNGATGAPSFRAIVASDIPVLNQSTTGYSNALASIDTRAVTPTPTNAPKGITLDFKSIASSGLEGGTYGGVLTVRPYGTSSDYTGGNMYQLGFPDTTGNIWQRMQSGNAWASWRKLWDSGNLINVSQLTNDAAYITAAANTASATKLQTPRNINGVAFDGTANITVFDATKEPSIAAGTTSQYYRGDKTWVTLDKVAAGLPNVDNTSDVNKPVSTATQTALNLLAPLANPALTGVPTAPTAPTGTNTTQLATTAYVANQISSMDATKISASRPSVRAALMLDFVNSRAVDPRITFARSSTATRFNERGAYEVVAANTPRIDYDPITKQCNGLLIEESRTNLMVRSQGSTGFAGAGTTPPIVEPNVRYLSETCTGITFTSAMPAGYSSTRAEGFGTNSATFIANTTYTLSVYMSLSRVLTGTETVVVYFTGGAGSQQITVNAAASSGYVGNFVRIIIPNFSYTSGGSDYPVVFMSGAATSNLTVYINKLQFEQGTFATSYIPSVDTFTGRTSTGTYYDVNGVMQTAASGVERISYNPANLTAPPMSLYESASTNLALYSADFSNAAWSNAWGGAATNTPNDPTYLSPMGTQTVTKCVSTSGNAGVGQSVTLTAGVTYTLSMWVASPGGGTTLRFATGPSSGFVAWVIIPASTTLTRYTLTYVPASTGTYYVGVSQNNALQTSYHWGGQLEANAYASSYIATTSAAVTRAADTVTSATATRATETVTMPTSTWYSPVEGSIYLESTLYGGTSSGSFQAAIVQDSNNFWALNYVTTSGISGINQINGTDQTARVSVTQPAGSSVPGVISKRVSTISAFGGSSAVDGVLNTGSLNLAVTVPKSPTLYLGQYGVSSVIASGYIRQLRYYAKKLSDTEIVAITSP